MKKVVLILALAFVSCVANIDQEGLPCPCGLGYECCATTNTCLPAGATCPSGSGEEDAGEPDADPPDFGPPDLGPPDMGSTIGGPCFTADDCTLGEVCLFWNPGCGIQGVCAAACPTRFDACSTCVLHCGCDGVEFEGCATRPFRSRGYCPVTHDAAVAPDA